MRIGLESILIACIILCWGLWGFFGKLALNERMPPISIFYAEVIVGFVIGAVLAGFFFFRDTTPAITQNWSIYGLFSGAALAVGILLYYLVLQKSPASVVVPVTATYPVLTVILSVALLAERLTITQWLGVALLTVGLVLLLSGQSTP